MIIRATTTALGLALASTAALAHPGHIAPASGHGHTELLAGLAVIAALGLPLVIRALRRR